MNRRTFLKWTSRGAAGSILAGGVYPLLEAKWLRLERVTVAIPNLPRPFAGKTIAFLADIHHGPYTPLSYVRHAVAMANAQKPDIVALGGDYLSEHPRYIAPAIAELGKLRARLGRVAVRGNHDNWADGDETRLALTDAGLSFVDNAGLWLEHRGTRLRIGGVGDLWTDHTDLAAALGDATERDAAIVLSHNPDVTETIDDRRVGLVLSGHTHGGQVALPGHEARWAPTRYGAKYLRGLCQGPVSPVYVTRGVGSTGPPVRLRCRPEVTLLTLVPATS